MRCRALLRTDYNFRRRTWNSTNRLRSFAKWPRLVRQLDDQSYTWHGSQGHRPPSHPEAQRDRTASRQTPAIYIPRDSSSTYWNVFFFYPSALQIATRKTTFCIQYALNFVNPWTRPFIILCTNHVTITVPRPFEGQGSGERSSMVFSY